MLESRQRKTFLLLAAALAMVVVTYRETFASIVRKWEEDSSFSHGYVVLPVVLWLAWRKRHELRQTLPDPSWLGVILLAGCSAAWVVARGTGVLVVEQAAAVGSLAAMFVAVAGPAVTRVLTFPLAFMFFAVPFGRAIVPVLMHLTADFATAALQLGGVPVFRDHMHIMIPGGWFEVAKACSGLNFVTTGLVLGVLYAHLNFQGWRKRAICVAAFVAIPILANGVRVYLTILVSHLTDMRFGPGAEHVTFGRVFFVLVLIAMIWIGRRWHDEIVVTPAGQSAPQIKLPPTRPGLQLFAPALVALLVVLATPPYLALSLRGARAQLAESAELAVLPEGQSGWTGPQVRDGAWRPLYEGSLLQRLGSYRDPAGAHVDAFVAVYGLGTSMGVEMISYDNVLFAGEHASLAVSEARRVPLPEGTELAVREIEIPDRGSTMLVWSWFEVGNRRVTGDFAVKAWEAAAFVLRNADSERIVTLATPLDGGARERLRQFVEAHAECVEAGFAGKACTG